MRKTGPANYHPGPSWEWVMLPGHMPATSGTPTLEQSATSETVLTPRQMAFFQEHGYITLESITTPDEVVRIRGILENLFASKAGFKEGAQFNIAGLEDDPNAPSLPQIISPQNYAKGLHKTEFFKRALVLAKQILGPEARYNNDHTVMKPGTNGPATPWHQDEAFRDPSYDYNEISIWMPLQPVNEANGCIQFIPGSHQRGFVPHRSPNNDPRVHALEAYTGFDLASALPCELPAGGCSIHTGRTIHGSGPNLSGVTRYAYVLVFNTPPRKATEVRHFPWLAEKNTARMERMRSWLKGRGAVVEAWRTIRKTNVTDYPKMVPKLFRKAKIATALLLSGKKSD